MIQYKRLRINETAISINHNYFNCYLCVLSNIQIYVPSEQVENVGKNLSSLMFYVMFIYSPTTSGNVSVPFLGGVFVVLNQLNW